MRQLQKKNLGKPTMKSTSNLPNIKVEVGQDVYKKMRQLCSVIADVEWSGILLYETIGSIRDPENMRLVAKDIILMDKGSQAYTSYNFTEKKRNQEGFSDRHIDYCEEFEEALTWQIGLIHSHNKMRVFFSATDVSELEDNCGLHNFYLSFIVNNKMEMVAKVAYMAVATTNTDVIYKANDENGEPYEIERKTVAVSDQKMITHDCDIEIIGENEEESFFDRNLRDILASVPKTTSFPSYKAPTGYNKPKSYATHGWTGNKPKKAPTYHTKYNQSWGEDYPFDEEMNFRDFSNFPSMPEKTMQDKGERFLDFETELFLCSMYTRTEPLILESFGEANLHNIVTSLDKGIYKLSEIPTEAETLSYFMDSYGCDRYQVKELLRTDLENITVELDFYSKDYPITEEIRELILNILK